ncbi:hypothetical protein C8J57DRAFT_1540008 [Mycena rebaudengoi]|nr:hypothetical protein C8J57DRAFT_1540008 [Mycena rebaudengoi]
MLRHNSWTRSYATFRNTKVGAFNRTGKRWTGHFNIWISDESVETAADVNVAPSFTLPELLMTRISTAETFGIIPVPQTNVRDLDVSPINPVRVGNTQSMVVHHHGTPSHLLTHISTGPTSPYQYLATRQRTENAIVPIHTSAEFRLFNEPMMTGDFYRDTKGKQPITSTLSQTVDFEKLAKHWTTIIHPRSVETAL